jgi:hypothetical protein
MEEGQKTKVAIGDRARSFQRYCRLLEAIDRRIMRSTKAKLPVDDLLLISPS